MDPVPDPLLLRKYGSAVNRTRDLWVSSQELWPLDHRGGHHITYFKMAVSPNKEMPHWGPVRKVKWLEDERNFAFCYKIP
jgi:hypothetical protein